MSFIEANNPFREQDDGPDPCDECEGTGHVTDALQAAWGTVKVETVCPVCHGTGQKPPLLPWSERER